MHHVGAPLHTLRALDARVALVRQAQLATRRHDEDGPPHQGFGVHVLVDAPPLRVLLGEDLEGADDLLHISRPDHQEVGHRTELRQDLNRLVRGAVLAEVNRVVRAYVEDRKLGYAGHADGGEAVLVEHREERAVRDQASIGGDAVQNRQASVLPDTEVDVAPRIARGSWQPNTLGRRQEVALDCWEMAAARAGHISRASNDGWVHLHKALEDVRNVAPPRFVFEWNASFQSLRGRLHRAVCSWQGLVPIVHVEGSPLVACIDGLLPCAELLAHGLCIDGFFVI
mmetsp:Transcript_23373/g.64743  ORF Transcript_23373/g.64743 Transcript_23373/m.64743 type:complete len:284 (-) Transcript_23373:1308-2159(-)